jgi:hypothetical protein
MEQPVEKMIWYSTSLFDEFVGSVAAVRFAASALFVSSTLPTGSIGSPNLMLLLDVPSWSLLLGATDTIANIKAIVAIAGTETDKHKTKETLILLVPALRGLSGLF